MAVMLPGFGTDYSKVPGAREYLILAHVNITLEVKNAAVTYIELNAAEVNITDATLFQTGQQSRRLTITTGSGNEAEKVGFSDGKHITRGRYVLQLFYTGMVQESLAGLYKSKYKSPEGKEMWVLRNIQFHRTAWKMTKFDDTPKMSTYLLALVIHDFEKTTRQFKRNDGHTIPMDMFAIPDFAAGAMENWGLVTYRERAVLLRGIHTEADRRRVAEVIAHELAHQWFGNLVTMEWWDDLWLNEGFATYTSFYAMGKLDPSLLGDELLVADQQDIALTLDVKASVKPVHFQADTAVDVMEGFGTIQYKKGASLVLMIAESFGHDVFWEAISHYLNTHKYGNARTADLWAALQKVAKEKNVPLNERYGPGGFSAAAEKWTHQMGFPVVNVAQKGPAGDGMMEWTLTQHRYYLGNPEEMNKQYNDSMDKSASSPKSRFPPPLPDPTTFAAHLTEVSDRMEAAHEDSAKNREHLMELAEFAAACRLYPDDCGKAFKVAYEEFVHKPCFESNKAGSKMASSCATTPAYFRKMAYCEAVRAAGPGDKIGDEVLELYKLETDQMESNDLLAAITCSNDWTALEALLDGIIDKTGLIRAQDSIWVTRGITANYAHADKLFPYLKSRFPKLISDTATSSVQDGLGDILALGLSTISTDQELEEAKKLQESAPAENKRLKNAGAWKAAFEDAWIRNQAQSFERIYCSFSRISNWLTPTSLSRWPPRLCQSRLPEPFIDI
ncbi:unnamed protein product, partial [Mesorhabditis spiculigera]